MNRAYTGGSGNGIWGTTGVYTESDVYNSPIASYAPATPRGWDRVIYFNLSNSSSVYQDNAPVRPLSMATAFLVRY